jgi:hypothetical protein
VSRLQSIQNALREINESVFQELCDHFLIYKNSNYALLARTGSQVGKQKTIKGTPDTLILLPTGKYLLVEYSTNVTQGYKKIIGDIAKCLNPQKTHIPEEDIAEIIVCLNFNLSNEEIEKLRGLVAHTYIRLTVYTIDAISLELQFQHRNLTYEYLGLPIDTGQVVSIERFVKEYDRAGNHIATPLDNPFLERKKEGAELMNYLEQSDFIILAGAPGVGKTKLALEIIVQYVQLNLSFNAFCISYKSAELISDLYQYLPPDKDFILFIDDANRIDAFSQIVGFYRNERKGRLKIVITVRDYAYQTVGALCQQFQPIRMDLLKMNDDEILTIIQNEPFKILNPLYFKPIISIADGNPRMAIMAALLSRKHESPLVLKDVSDLFDQYFASFVTDTEEFEKTTNLKCLGLIAFFYTINFKDKTIILPILDDFDIDYNIFIDTIDRLEKLELVEIQYEHVKVSEQNLGIYFFYRTFIKQESLSFEKLLFRYFPQQKSRFRECVIAALNTFDDKLILNRIKPILISYLKEFAHERGIVFPFFDIFWFFLRLETIEYIYELIRSLPEPGATNFVFELPDKRNHYYDKEELIEVLGDFYRTGYEIKSALECGIQYIAKEPGKSIEFITTLKAHMGFSFHDENNGFFREKAVLNFLLSQIEAEKRLPTLVFFELAKLWLKFRFQHSECGRNNAIQIYYFIVTLSTDIKYFRSKIWETLNTNFPKYPNEILQVLIEYGRISPDTVEDVMAFDVSYVVEIIDKHLNSQSFEHCRYVQSQLRWFIRKQMHNDQFEELLKRFCNPMFEVFLKIDWDRLRDKEMYEFDDYKEYETLKTKEIRESFIFSTLDDVYDFYKSFVYLKAAAKNDWSYNNSLDIVIEANLANDLQIGLMLLATVITDNNKIGYVPRRLFYVVLKTHAVAHALHELIWSSNFQYKNQWQVAYFEHLSDVLITKEDVKSLLETVRKIETKTTIYFENFVKYLVISPDIFEDILRIIYEINEKKDVGIQVWMDFFANHFSIIEKNVSLAELTYLQQIKLYDFHFDYDMKGLKKILAVDPAFLVSFIKTLHNNDLYHREHRSMAFVWDIVGIEPFVTEVFNSYSDERAFCGLGETFFNSFFDRLDESQKKIADNFLLTFLEVNFSDPAKINLAVDIVRHSRRELFDSVLLKYISLNNNVDDFSKIYWRGNGGLTSGDVISGDIEAADWRNILSIIEKHPEGLALISIRKYVSNMIESSLRSGDWERKRRFLYRD